MGVAGDGAGAQLGLARSIGVSNFSAGELDEVHGGGNNPRPSTRRSSARWSEDMAKLDALDQTNGTDRALEETWW